MRYVLSKSSDPYFNLAAEEYLLKHTKENIFMLWRSIPTVIVGKHQNALAEINYPYVLKNNLKLARRLSGGGTVVHDPDNLNFTFISNGEEGKLIDFKKFTGPIIDFLNTLGIHASLGDKNDIRIGELKISGNAEHVYKKRILHHGTLLFDSDLYRLKKAIQVVPGKYFDNAVQSNRARVTNIFGFLKEKATIEVFTDKLSAFVLGADPDVKNKPFSVGEELAISKLSKEKYAREDWIFGYSPKYEFRHSFLFNGSAWIVKLNVEKGRILKAIVQVNNQNQNNLEKELFDQNHNINEINRAIKLHLKDISDKECDKLSLNFF